MMEPFILIAILIMTAVVCGACTKNGFSFDIMALGLTLVICILIQKQQIETYYMLFPILLIALSAYRGSE